MRTGKIKILEGKKEYTKFYVIISIMQLIESHKIKKPMVLNVNQIPLKHVPCLHEKKLSLVSIRVVSGT